MRAYFFMRQCMHYSPRCYNLGMRKRVILPTLAALALSGCGFLPSSSSSSSSMESSSEETVYTLQLNPINESTVFTNAPGVAYPIQIFDQEGHVLTDSMRDQVRWSSSDPAIISVTEEGVVQGVSNGEAIIKATLGEASAEITLYSKTFSTEFLELPANELTLKEGETHPFAYVATPSTATVDYEIDDSTIIEYSEDGIRALAPGNTLITFYTYHPTGGEDDPWGFMKSAIVCHISVEEVIYPRFVYNEEVVETCEIIIPKYKYQELDWATLGLHAYDKNDKDLTSQIEVEGEYDLNVVDVYHLTLSVTDEENLTTTLALSLVVDEYEIKTSEAGREGTYLNTEIVPEFEGGEYSTVFRRIRFTATCTLEGYDAADITITVYASFDAKINDTETWHHMSEKLQLRMYRGNSNTVSGTSDYEFMDDDWNYYSRDSMTCSYSLQVTGTLYTYIHYEAPSAR